MGSGVCRDRVAQVKHLRDAMKSKNSKYEAQARPRQAKKWERETETEREKGNLSVKRAQTPWQSFASKLCLVWMLCGATWRCYPGFPLFPTLSPLPFPADTYSLRQQGSRGSGDTQRIPVVVIAPENLMKRAKIKIKSANSLKNFAYSFHSLLLSFSQRFASNVYPTPTPSYRTSSPCFRCCCCCLTPALLLSWQLELFRCFSSRLE